VLIYSAHRQPQAQHTVGRQLRKQGEQEVQAFQQLCRSTFACEADAQQALATFTQANRVIILFPSVGNEADRVESA
jgi:hypothetical protein